MGLYVIPLHKLVRSHMRLLMKITNNTKLRFYAITMQNFEQEHKTNKIPSEILNMTTF